MAAQVIVAEIGTDISRFPTAGHLISWAGLCPNHEKSAGKRPRCAHARMTAAAPSDLIDITDASAQAALKRGIEIDATGGEMKFDAQDGYRSAGGMNGTGLDI